MTEEIKAAAAVETPAPEVHKPTQQEIQGKKATTKKKIKNYSDNEIHTELKRMEKTGGTHSVYYKHLRAYLALR